MVISEIFQLQFRVDLGNSSELVVPLNITIGNVALRAEYGEEDSTGKYSKVEEAENNLVHSFATEPAPSDVNQRK